MLTKTSDQNFVFCGNIQWPAYASILGKIDENGNILWAKAYQPGIFSNGSHFIGVYESLDNCLIATGSYIEVPWDGFNYIVKCDSAGNSNCFSNDILWTFTPVLSKDSVIVCSTINGNISTITVLVDCFCDSTILLCSGNVGLDHTNSLFPSLIVYPNPFIDKINIEINNSTFSEIEIYSIDSRKVIQEMFMASTTIDLKILSKGLYFYIVRSNNNIVGTGKIIKDL